MTLIFREEDHSYWLDGVRLPSVSEVKEPLTDFSHVDPDVLKKAQEFGKAVHKMVELYFREELDFSTLDEPLFGPLEALERWLAEVKPFNDPAGALIDIKSRPFDRNSDPVQLAAYNQLVIENGVAEVSIERPLASAKHRYAGTPDIVIPPVAGGIITNLRILELRLDGTYKYTPANEPQAWPIFGVLLNDYWRAHDLPNILNAWRNRV